MSVNVNVTIYVKKVDGNPVFYDGDSRKNILITNEGCGCGKISLVVDNVAYTVSLEDLSFAICAIKHGSE